MTSAPHPQVVPSGTFGSSSVSTINPPGHDEKPDDIVAEKSGEDDEGAIGPT